MGHGRGKFNDIPRSDKLSLLARSGVPENVYISREFTSVGADLRKQNLYYNTIRICSIRDAAKQGGRIAGRYRKAVMG